MYWNEALQVMELLHDGRLTLTWDVLKYNKNTPCFTPEEGLTLTWDVLK